MTAEHAAAAGGEVEALASVLDRHVTDAAFDAGCRLSCGYDGDDLTRHMAAAVLAAGWGRSTAADTVLATARRLCCGDNPAPEHTARADHSTRMAFAEELARAVRGS